MLEVEEVIFMMINAILLDQKDNVVTCVREVAKGETVAWRDGEAVKTIVAEETIPYCHKIALVDIGEGDEVIKYGELIGKADTAIPAGHWVYHENIHSVPRSYDDELVPDDGADAEPVEVVPTEDGPKFWGYRRAEGRPGIRNHVLILPSCACGSESSRIVASHVRGAVNIVFNTGCSDVADNTAMSQKVLTGFACNPNVYGVVIIGLGCETVGHKELREKIQKMTSKPVVSFGIPRMKAAPSKPSRRPPELPETWLQRQASSKRNSSISPNSSWVSSAAVPTPPPAWHRTLRSAN